MPTAMNEPFQMDDEEKQARQAAALEARKTVLASVLSKRRTEAVNARQASGIEQIWREDEDQYNGYDEVNQPSRVGEISALQGRGPAGTGKTAAGRSKVFLNVTQPKTDAAEARVCEMLLPSDDKPWAFDPTPVPELANAVEQGDQELVTLADGKQVPAELVARVVMAKAQTCADEHEKWVEDHFVEGRVYGELRKLIKESARLGTAVLKGPFPVARTDKKWITEGGVTKLVQKDRIAPTSRKISVWDFFPDPAAGEDIHEGGYVIERDHLTARQLRRLAKDPEYLKDEIRLVLEEGPKKRARDDRQAQDYPGETRASDSDVFEVWYYYGDVDRRDLEALGMDELPEDQSHMAAIVTMVNEHIIKAAINPLDTGDFPYDVFPWEPMAGQPWGRGVARKMSVPQRMLNASARAMLENAGLSSGPQIIIRKGLVQPADGRHEITGRKLWFFEGDDTTSDIRDAMAVFNIPSNQGELQNIINFALQMADETAAMPMLLQGEQNPGQPETLGGQTMRQNNASGLLRRIAKQADDSIFIPHLSRYYDWGMQNGPEAIKGDLQVRAKGSSTLFQRDQSNQFLMQTGPMVENPKFKIDPELWFSEMCKANHFDPATIQYTETRWKEIQAQQEQTPPPQDPRVVAATERTKQVELDVQARKADREAEREFEGADRQADRQHQAAIKAIEREIQVMEFAGRRQISLEQIKALLASKAADVNVKRELFDKETMLKMSPANPTNQGI